jgi:hypothetical protein
MVLLFPKRPKIILAIRLSQLWYVGLESTGHIYQILLSDKLYSSRLLDLTKTDVFILSSLVLPNPQADLKEFSLLNCQCAAYDKNIARKS